MTLPRPALLALLGLALVAAAFLALRAAAGGDEAPLPASTPAVSPPTPARAKRAPLASPDASRGASQGTLPRPVARALARRRPIVLFLSQAGGADDAATRGSVRSLRARPQGAAVFSDRVENIARYRRIVGNLDVSQAPSIVIVPPRRSQARLLEGFIDEASLRQQLVDASR